MNYTVIGAAKSGLAAALLAKRKGHNVFLSESKDKDSFIEAYEILTKNGIDTEFYGNTEKALENCDCIITSPGVPPTAWVIQDAEKQGIPIISELEFARLHCPKNPLIAITGTNGKTTTTTLTTFIFNKSGKKAIECGNIGTPLSEIADTLDPDTVIVAEVSSFQLDRIDKFRPDVAIILNLTPDHINYHGDFESYQHAKFKISSNQIENNLLVLNADDNCTHGASKKTKAKPVYFSMSPVDWGIYIKGDIICIKLPGELKEEEIMSVGEIRLPGPHNVFNSMAAAIAARAFEIRNEDIRDCLMAFQGVEHRLEYVATIDDVDYINDSKATNINATWYALKSFNKPIVWIAGGRGDNNDYSILDDLVKSNVRSIICLGEDADAIFNHFSSMVKCVKQESFEDAVKAAKIIANQGDVVLFTPACKSFDMFVNYEHRGEAFKSIINSLHPSFNN